MIIKYDRLLPPDKVNRHDVAKTSSMRMAESKSGKERVKLVAEEDRTKKAAKM